MAKNLSSKLGVGGKGRASRTDLPIRGEVSRYYGMRLVFAPNGELVGFGEKVGGIIRGARKRYGNFCSIAYVPYPDEKYCSLVA